MRIIITSLLFFAFLGCTDKKTLPINDFRVLSPNESILLDVRTPEEFESGHIPGSININVLDPTFISKIEKLNKNKEVYVYCQKGGRSAKATKLIDSLGYKAIDLIGGFEAYSAQEQ